MSRVERDLRIVLSIAEEMFSDAPRARRAARGRLTGGASVLQCAHAMYFSARNGLGVTAALSPKNFQTFRRMGSRVLSAGGGPKWFTDLLTAARERA